MTAFNQDIKRVPDTGITVRGCKSHGELCLDHHEDCGYTIKRTLTPKQADRIRVKREFELHLVTPKQELKLLRRLK
jgi:hypothetical protein